jgi:hypothetical protein
MTSSRYLRHSSNCNTLTNLGVRSARSLAEPCAGSVEHERGGGGHFSPRRMFYCASQALHFVVAAHFYGRQSWPELAKRGHRGGIHSFPALISDDYGGEGKTASCRLRKIARELRILPRCPHQSRYQLFLHSLSFLLLFKPRPSSISSIHLPLTNYSFR